MARIGRYTTVEPVVLYCVTPNLESTLQSNRFYCSVPAVSMQEPGWPRGSSTPGPHLLMENENEKRLLAGNSPPRCTEIARDPRVEVQDRVLLDRFEELHQIGRDIVGSGELVKDCGNQNLLRLIEVVQKFADHPEAWGGQEFVEPLLKKCARFPRIYGDVSDLRKCPPSDLVVAYRQNPVCFFERNPFWKRWMSCPAHVERALQHYAPKPGPIGYKYHIPIAYKHTESNDAGNHMTIKYGQGRISKIPARGKMAIVQTTKPDMFYKVKNNGRGYLRVTSMRRANEKKFSPKYGHLENFTFRLAIRGKEPHVQTLIANPLTHPPLKFTPEEAKEALEKFEAASTPFE